MFRKHRPPVGARPGMLVPLKEAVAPRITAIKYNTTEITEHEISDVEELRTLWDPRSTLWVDIQGLGNIETLEKIGEIFSIHPLALEDIINIPQRPKAEEYDEQLYIVTIMITMLSVPRVKHEQISIFLGNGFVLTFQEEYGDILDRLRARLRAGKGIIRKSGADYLAYAILDAVIDAYYGILEKLGDYIEELENEVISNPRPEVLPTIYSLRRDLLALRRSIFPQREVLSGLIRDENRLIKKATRTYLRDCYDHCAQVIDVLETYRELGSGLMDVYLSGVSNKMNEVMKVLTIISTIFIPLSFLAGLYGMNFEHMPELKYDYAYPIFWTVILVLGFGMLGYFRYIGWLGKSEAFSPDLDDRD